MSDYTIMSAFCLITVMRGNEHDSNGALGFSRKEANKSFRYLHAASSAKANQSTGNFVSVE